MNNPSDQEFSSSSAWAPLRRPVFRALWIASLASNIGTWVQDVGGAWLMTSLAPSPLMVAMVQAATTLPMFALALPGGVLADLVDRRRLLLFTQTWMMTVATALGAMTVFGITTAWSLLGMTFLIAFGAALTLPAWQAIVPDLVPSSELLAAVTLNGVGFNTARAVGPALGGLIVAAAGPGAAFLLNAVSFIGIIVVLYRWRRSPVESTLPTERFFGAIRAGVRYLRHAPELRTVLVRAALFISCASALWALMPLIARKELGLGASGYGMLLGFFGAGAVSGAAVLPRLRQKVSLNFLVTTATLLFAAIAFALAVLRYLSLVCGVMFFSGAAWLTLLSSLNVAVQTSVPSWIRARALSAYLLVFFGGMAGGSPFWGALATHMGIPTALRWSAVGLVVGTLATFRYRVTGGRGLNLAPSKHWPAPRVVIEPNPERGPVMVIMEYRIDPETFNDFALAMHDLSRIRRRDGAIQWSLFSDVADPNHYIESFIVESWAEHLRQHERMTVEDRQIEAQVRAFHIGDKPPRVSHFIAEPLPKREH